MRNFSKILCVVLALVVALSAASCSMTKQHAYNEDDVELPIGVYISYLYTSYNQAANYAQQSDKYDASTGKYDGKTSFLKMEINVDGEDEPIVAEDWIKKNAIKETKHAVAVSKKYKELGCTMDEAAADQVKDMYKGQWDEQYKETLEGYGISFDSFFMLTYTLPTMENEVLKAEYAVNGPSPVSDEELGSYFKENYTSYKHFHVNLYTESTADEADASAETQTVSTPFTEEQIAKYQASFTNYAGTLSKGGSFDDVVAKYKEDYGVETANEDTHVEVIEDDTTDEIAKAIKGMKDGQAMTLEIGETEETKQLYVIYREPIENQLEAYTDRDNDGFSVLQKMKQDDFDKLLDGMLDDISLSSSCNSYEPSIFDEKKK